MFLQKTMVEKAAAEGPQQVPAVAGRRSQEPIGDPLVGLQEDRLASAREGNFTICIKCFANVLIH